MKITRNEERILEDIHRYFSKIATLFDELSEETKQETLKYHAENNSINHCIRWGEIGISEIRDDLDYKKRWENN